MEKQPENTPQTGKLLPNGCDPRVIGAATQFQPGVSGNPGGRPKKSLLTDMTAELLDEIAADPERREQFKQSILQKLLAKGVVSAMTLDKLWERHEGKVTQPVEINGELSLSISERLRKAKERKRQG